MEKPLVTGIVMVLGLGGSVASAAIPDTTGAIHGCYAKPGLPFFSPPTGTLRGH
jgi:hypothetical protein